MPRRSRYPVSKSAPRGKGRRSRGERQVSRSPVTVASRQTAPSRNVPTAPISSAPIKQTTPQYLYVPGELKRIGIISGAMLLLLVILSMVL
jgi:hypothetical protein